MDYVTRAGRLLPAIFLVILAGCGGGGEPAGEALYVIKFPHVTAPATPKGQAAQRFKELAESRFPGRVRVEVYPSAQLMEDSDSLEALAFGEIQMIATSLSVFDRLTSRFQVFDLPFLFPDLEAVERFQRSETGQTLLTALSDQGMLGLAFWHNGMKQLGAPRPLRIPADAAGLKFRIMESDVLQAQIQAFGGSPQKMAFGEVYQALQTGTVDAQENTFSNMYSSKFYEVQPYITETNHGYIGYFVAVNAAFWQGLPDDLREGLERTLAEVTEWGNARSADINAEGRRNIIDSGRSEIIELTPAELAEWRQAVAPVWDQFRDRIGTDLIAAAQAASSAGGQ
jgi:C4-dicarboxylate-binding protein DctP